LIGAKS